MPNRCSTNNKLLAQTLFLGASVTSFNCNLGWSGQASQLTVNLTEDLPVGLKSDNTYGYPCNFNQQYPTPAISCDTDNYYYSCAGDNCYIDRDGSAWSTGNIGTQRASDGSTINDDDAMLPGKLYYYFNSSYTDPFVSRYYRYPDPGFLGNPNRFNNNGTISYTTNTINSGYDIIGTPVYFKMENFTFGGIVQSWEENLGQGGKQYKVVVEGMQSILSSCYIIIGEYAGSIFSKYGSANPNYGAPRNYVGNIPNYAGSISEGNIPNVFNVYGFLESAAPDNFGGSDTNDEGMPAVDIMYALRILTSCINSNDRLKTRASTSHVTFGPKTAYSPYGRILVKSAQKYYTYEKIGDAFNSFGVIPAQTNLEDGVSYCEFLLDLSEIPNPPKDFRIKGPVLTITDFLNQVTEAVGYDYAVELIPITYSSRIYNVIKIKTISRLKQTTANEIANTVKSLYAAGYDISSSTVGKEKNESPSRCVIIGGKQQRLLQAKSYRLAYTQSNLIFDARNRCFVDYMALGRINVFGNSISRTSAGASHFSYGKIKFPSFLSTRNPKLNTISNPRFSNIFGTEEDLRVAADGVGFYTQDSTWPDKEITASSNLGVGNYVSTIKSDHPAIGDWAISSSALPGLIIPSGSAAYGHGSMNQKRYFPLYRDIICPFFGYLMDNEYDIDTTKSTSTSDFRRPRPVFFDTWTGQICVLFRASELPKTRVNLEGLYGGFSGFNRVANPYSGNGLSTPTTPTPTTTAAPGPGTPSPTPTPPAPTSVTYNSNGSSVSRSEHFFILTESEMRAALAGADEFLIYNTGKTYKTDLYMMMHEAYVNKLTGLYGGNITKAKQECSWHWRLKEQNVGGLVMTPAVVAPDKSAGAEYIPEDVRKDFELLQKFAKGIAEKYYGKKYMVQVPYLTSREDRSFADIALPTQAGYAYVFRGDNKFRFSYEPTNAGGWEEYGNIIDDCIAVGGRDWSVLSNDQGLILPIVGYNATDRFDSVNYNVCVRTIGNEEKNKKLNPAFAYNAWYEHAKETQGTCNVNNFIFPSIDVGALTDPTRYVIVKLKSNSVSSYEPITSNFSSLSFNTGILTSAITEPNAFGNVSFPRKKLFYSTDVEEKFVFLNPETLQDPRVVINAPGLPLNSSTQQFQKDPNSTVIATIAVEDAAVYLRATSPANWDYDFLNMLSSYVEKVSPEGYLYGSYASLSKISSSLNVMLKPKMMHPFFAGIPIKSNQYNYGPWTNYPHRDISSDNIFSNGIDIQLDPTVFPLSATTGTITITPAQATNAINNWILPTTVTFNPEFVPWNYGGMSFLDSAALSEAKSKVNYQSILETATIEMAGLPRFNLGGSFNTQVMNNVMPVSATLDNFAYKETKATTNSMNSSVSISDLNSINQLHTYTYTQGSLNYSVIRLDYNPNALKGPIISTIGVDIGQNGVKTTYMFRTYTRKLSLFNKEYSDKIKKFTKENLNRQKEIAKIEQQIENKVNNENVTIMEQKGDRITTNALNSRLLGTSPVEVIVASAGPYIPPPYRNPPYSEEENSQNMPRPSTAPASSASYSVDLSGDDLGNQGMFTSGFSDATTNIPFLSDRGRIRTTTTIYQRTELADFIKDEYGSKSLMSLDGIFSPVSFYPTNSLSTFPFSKYHVSTCPVCNGAGSRKIDYKKYTTNGPSGEYTVTCNACCRNNEKLNSSLDFTSKTTANNGELIPPFVIASGTDISAISSSRSKFGNISRGLVGQSVPVNLVSLQPLIVPYGEFKNPNSQNYTGGHPEGYHVALSLSGKTRNFVDRCRHSIGIVGRSSVNQKSIEIHKNIDNNKFLYSYPTGTTSVYHADFFHRDLEAIYNLSAVSGNRNSLSVQYEMNQRFIGLRGPIVMHAWGYDKQGYPVPNAADEPLEVDEFNRAKRFKVIRTLETATTWEKLAVGDVFVLSSATDANAEMIKAVNLTIQNLTGNRTSTTALTNTSSVQKVIYKDDYSSDGGFDPATYKGSIIGKTQQFINGKWTQKTKLREFYLNWGERPDTWPVGPIDLRWDESKKVWTANTPTVYKMMYVTLEEDLIKHADLDDTYPARGFLDDVDFSAQPMPSGTRRIAFVKDRCGYTAPRGAKLLCRYDTDSGFYEPISKPSFIVKGNITAGSNQASIEMSYMQGRRRGESYPSMVINFDNPFDLSTAGGKGLFTYINGKWTLTTAK